ncbi:unnamed protein product [Ilex paraguariensis]|uniref:Uncharacterized protein n=1 Tax=Ilex paraguariensis TaxID=185542 RepID=A0ABC8T9J2_9AQUA
MIVSKAFMAAYPAHNFNTDAVLSTQPQGDFVWRIVLMFGAVPAALTYYWRMKMPETARYTALVAGNHKKAAADMAKVLEKDILVEESNSKLPMESTSYGLFRKNSRIFILQLDSYIKPQTMNAIEEVFHISKAMFLVALFATVPGYWFTVFLIDRIGRFVIQLGGFLLMSIFMLVLGVKYEAFRGKPCADTKHKDSLNDFVTNYTQKAEGIKRAIIALSVVNLLGFLFTFLVPETNGRSLEEISGEDKDLGGGNGGTSEANGNHKAHNNGIEMAAGSDMV